MRLSLSRLKFTLAFAFLTFTVLASAVTHFGQAVLPPQTFESFLKQRFGSKEPDKWSLDALCPVSESIVAARVLRNYGAMYAARESVTLPHVCIYRGEVEFRKYRESLKTTRLQIGPTSIELQIPAAEALQQAIIDAEINGLRITPLDGAIAGGRSYGDTLMLWNSRVFPAMDYWIRLGRLSETDREEFSKLELDARIKRILEWESRGIFFSKDRSRSIMTSTAPPGASQHLSFMAFDIVEYWSPDVRSILNRNGWYQTIVDDPPHFTYLGVQETQLPGRGLRSVAKGGFLFWVPNMEILPELAR
jgi:hypothetical protein